MALAPPPLLTHLAAHADRVAVCADTGPVTYRALVGDVDRLAAALLARAGSPDLAEGPVAFAVTPGAAWIATFLAIGRAGGLAVPLALSHPPEELGWVLDDTGARLVVADAACAPRLAPLVEERGLTLLGPDEAAGPAAAVPPPEGWPAVDVEQGAILLYTSGTTSRPKGVVITHGNLDTQTRVLGEAWRWQPNDHALGTLPLHHVHGIVNVVACALRAGARLTLLPAFDVDEVWRQLAEHNVTVLMAVPTIYHRLIQSFDAAPDEQARRRDVLAGLRLMVSGSAALPVPTLERWREISGHVLLERYGMTEIGMALSNPYEGERVAGTVGYPLPTVEVRLRDGDTLLEGAQDGEGELEVRGPSVFREYWRRPEATRDAFTDDGWFRTGDRAARTAGRYRILGRTSIDILKTGGFKVSALEIESVLTEHPSVGACAVVGLPHEEWGEEVVAAVEPAPGCVVDGDAVRAWAKERLAPYKVPRRVVTRALPRNAMGKVQKPVLVAELAGQGG